MGSAAFRMARWLIATPLRAWALLWAWCHPAAGPALDDALRGEIDKTVGWRRLAALAMFAIVVPGFVRRQAAAERRHATQTAGQLMTAAGRAGGRAREALVWIALAGWAVAAVLFVHSVATTGTFAPDYAITYERPARAGVMLRFGAGDARIYDREGTLLYEFVEAYPGAAGEREVISTQFAIAAVTAGIPTLALGVALLSTRLRRVPR